MFTMNVLLLYCICSFSSYFLKLRYNFLQMYCSGIYEGSLCHYILIFWNHVTLIFECVVLGNLKKNKDIQTLNN